MKTRYRLGIIGVILALAPLARAQDQPGPTDPVQELLQELHADPAKPDETQQKLTERVDALTAEIVRSVEAINQVKNALAENANAQDALKTNVAELENALSEARAALAASAAAAEEAEKKLAELAAAKTATEEKLEVHESALKFIESSRENESQPAPPPAHGAPQVITASAEQTKLFNTRVLPVLQDNCFGCHGPDKQKSEMRLDSLAGMLQGGQRGPAIVPGNPDESRLIQAIRQEGDLKMPPTGKLGPVAIALLTEWIRTGAAYGNEAPVLEPAPEATPAPNTLVAENTKAEPASQPKSLVSALQAVKEEKEQAAAEDVVSEATLERIAKAEAAVETSSVSFNRDIRPILSNKCFECHGPDQRTRKAHLSLHEAIGAYGELPSGKIPVVPGDRAASELYERITAADPDHRMPPAEFDKKLTDQEVALLTQWIDEGAPWEGHWSFIPPKEPERPDVANADWPRNAIDHFILARLEKEGLNPSPEADRRTLIRRASLDLTGLPPTPDEVQAFLDDTEPGAYERVVDRLLASPRYGEHKARIWLDAARYADTNGYHIDNERYMWPWRDWLIRAYNDNIPFDEFTIAQIAGDLLPNPSKDDLIATGFNRNHMINFEGGAIPEEYHTQYVVDRVNTTGTVWMGLTVGCAQCHDHKYDPISQKEFYQLYSFYYNVPEEGLDGRDGNAKPTMPVPSDDQKAQLDGVRALLAIADEATRVPMPEVDAAQADWEAKWSQALTERWTVLNDITATAEEGVTFEPKDDGSVLVTGENPAKPVYEITAPLPGASLTALRLEALKDESLPESGPGRASNANFVLTEFEAEILRPGGEAEPLNVAFASAKADHSQDKFDVAQAVDGNAETGWAILGKRKPEARTAYFVARDPILVEDGSTIRIRMRHESGSAQHGIGRFRISTTADETMAPSRLGPWYVNGPYRAYDGKEAYETDYGPESGIDLDETYDDGRMKWITAIPGYADGQVHRLSGDVAATYLYRTVTAPSARTMELAVGSNDAIKVWLNGKVVHDNNVERGIQPDQDKINVELQAGENQLLMKIVNYGNDYAFSFRKADEQAGEIPMDIEVLLASAERSAGDQRKLRDYYRERYSPTWRNVIAKRDELREQEKQIEAQIPTTMVMAELEDPRETFVLARGQYDQKDEPVKPGTPNALPPMPEGADANRLGLAKWLVNGENPLTARVMVNRYWQHHFGTGLVKTAEDFGAQGEWPTHPELLDWLATEFVNSGWDVKHLHRLIVTSAAYRQSSKSSPELNARDPKNRLIARGPRFRMDAEMIRDSALFVSGLLVERRGGPSVKPYQPKGIWEEVAYGANFTAQVFEPDQGDALHRRSMYTFWKRQAPPPNMMIFDAPNRETCTVRRERTNTPLQALALMNDPQFVEASHALAERMIHEGGESPADKIAYAFEWATARKPTEREQQIMLGIYEEQCGEFEANPESAVNFFASIPNKDVDAEKVTPQLAAYGVIANLILNLDEVVTKS